MPTAQLALCVLHVSDLVASIEFYAQVLDLSVSLRTDTAAMLTTDDGCQLVLLELGERLEPTTGSVGIQHVVWAAADRTDLNNIELKLKCLGARVSRQTIDGVTYVEGRDPSGLPIIVTNPSPHHAPPAHIFNRIYGRWL
jgi:catechol-2,3-dioxygenase